MARALQPGIVVIALVASFVAERQARAVVVITPLSAIVPGTENVTLLTNGDFELPGPDFDAGPQYVGPFPPNWARIDDAFVVDFGYSATAANGTFVGSANVDNLANTAGGYAHDAVVLAANTEYILSGYLWNFGGAVNLTLLANLDLSDAAGEPAIVLGALEPGAADGFFVYGTFNTATTGINVTARAFFDGDGTSLATIDARGVQFDNIAITLASEFQPPLANQILPEPTTLLLIGLGGSCLAPVARRRRS